MKKIIYRAYMDISSFIASSTDREITITVKHYEIYNEKIFDLSQLSDPLQPRSPLFAGLDSDSLIQIRGLNEVAVKNVQDIQNVILAGQKNRQVAETRANSHSSRSHAILEITITNEPKYYSDGATALKSTLQFVDLAGSESVDSTGTNRYRQQEGSNIKKRYIMFICCFDLSVLFARSFFSFLHISVGLNTFFTQPCYAQQDH